MDQFTLTLRLTHRSPQELEEGEITAVDEDKRRTDAYFSGLNFALYETLSGACSASAFTYAGRQAVGNLQVRLSSHPNYSAPLMSLHLI